MTDGTDAFLCYSWADKRRADELHGALTGAGLTVFQDEAGMRDYDHISERIDAALRSMIATQIAAHVFDEAWALIDNGAEALDDDLGPGHPAGLAADEVRRWITILGADRS